MMGSFLAFTHKFFLAFTLFFFVRGGPVKRDVVPSIRLNNVPNGFNKATQIGTEQGVVAVAPSNVNTNNNNGQPVAGDVVPTANNGQGSLVTPPSNGQQTSVSPPSNGQQTSVSPPSNNGQGQVTTPPPQNNAPTTQALTSPSNEKQPVVDAKLDEEEDSQVKPVAENGELQQTMTHPNGEVESVYSGKPEDVGSNDQKGTKRPVQTIMKPDGEIEKVYVGQPTNKSSGEDKVMKGATATLAHDTFNISIPLKPKRPVIIKYLGNETEGVYVKSPASEHFKVSCVREHNKKRLIHNAHAVVWSDKLAESAQTWADHLAEIDDDVKDTTNKKFGENVFWTRPELPEDELCKAAVDEWYNEVKLYDFAASHKRNYDTDSVNEFTQLVYDGQTREVGVAYSLSRSNKQYVVARYYKKRLNRGLDSEVHPPHSDSARVRFDRPIFQAYNMIFSLPRTPWVPQYNQENSPAYQQLKSKMKNAFLATFQESPSVSSMVDFKLNNIKLDDRVKGSTAILADVDVKFYPYVSDPIQRLRNSVVNGQLNGMEIDDHFLKVFNKTGVYEPPPSLKAKMAAKEMQADALQTGGATDPITGAPTSETYPQPISEDIDLLDRKPCQGGTCETYLIKERQIPENGSSPNIPGLPPGAGALPQGGGQQQQPCCNQLPPPPPCLALACPPPPPTPPCNPTCPPPSTGSQACPMPACPNNCCNRSNVLYRRGGTMFENHGH